VLLLFIKMEYENTEAGILQKHKLPKGCRWRCFARDYIRDQKGDSLDISWIKDEDSVDAASLPDPDVLAAEAMGELTEALRELDGLMQVLGAGDQALAQRELLVESLVLENASAE
jgi:type I restriction enzyme M protein